MELLVFGEWPNSSWVQEAPDVLFLAKQSTTTDGWNGGDGG